jgi:hypothetical protein
VVDFFVEETRPTEEVEDDQQSGEHRAFLHKVALKGSKAATIVYPPNQCKLLLKDHILARCLAFLLFTLIRESQTTTRRRIVVLKYVVEWRSTC